MKHYKSLNEFEQYIKEKKKHSTVRWFLWDFVGVPWERGFCQPEQKIAILLRNPHNGFYFIFSAGYPAYHYDWSEDAGDFKIYAFFPKDMKWLK